MAKSALAAKSVMPTLCQGCFRPLPPNDPQRPADVQLCPDCRASEERWYKLWLDYHSVRAGTAQPSLLDRYPRWPAIKKLACELFGHSDFTNDTWDLLESWCLAMSGGNRQIMLGGLQGVLKISLGGAIEDRTPWPTIPPEPAPDEMEQRERISRADAKRITDDLRACEGTLGPEAAATYSLDRLIEACGLHAFDGQRYAKLRALLRNPTEKPNDSLFPTPLANWFYRADADNRIAVWHAVCCMFLDEREYGTGHIGQWLFWSEARRLIADRIEAEAPGNTQQIAAQQWKHSPDTARPDRFRNGPIRGTNNWISMAMGEEPTRNHRLLKRKAKSDQVWVIEPTPGARELEVWFVDLLEYIAVAKKLKELTDNELPAGKRKAK